VPFAEQTRTGKFAKPCFNRQIGLCPGVCTGEISKEDYGKIIQQIKLFFEGRKKDVVKLLKAQMKEYASDHEFEKAEYIKRKIFALDHIRDVSLIKEENINAGTEYRIEAYDVAHISGTNVVGVMTVVEDGQVKKSDYRKFNMRIQSNNDVAGLKEILTRRLNHPEWPLPQLIVVDGGAGQHNAATEVLRSRGIDIAIIGVVKDERHKPKSFLGDEELIKKYSKDMLIANSEAHRFAITFHRKKRSNIFGK
jgi:excinuclease ABC subunit C